MRGIAISEDSALHRAVVSGIFEGGKQSAVGNSGLDVTL